QLVAYLVAHQGQNPTPGQLRLFLRQKLPDYMVPATFVQLDDLPLTANGKIDRRALSRLTPPQDEQSYPFIAPRNRTERTLAAIWCDILERKRVGMCDDFFELGGDSLLVLRLRAQIQQQFQQDLSFATLFQNPTIGQLAVVLDDEKREANHNLDAVPGMIE